MLFSPFSFFFILASGENKTLAARERADSLSFGTIQTLLRFESPRDLSRDFPNSGSKGGSRFRGAVVGSGAARSPLQPALRGRPPVLGVFSPRSHLCARSRLLRRTRGCGRAVAVPCPVSPGHGHAWQTPPAAGDPPERAHAGPGSEERGFAPVSQAAAVPSRRRASRAISSTRPLRGCQGSN